MKIYRVVKRERIITLLYMFYLCGIQSFATELFFLRIYCWSLWQQSGSFCFKLLVSNSFGKSAVCKIEAAFTVLLEAKSRSGRCPVVEDSTALIGQKKSNIGQCTMYSKSFYNSVREEIGQIRFLDASSHRLEAFYFSLCRLASVIRFHFTFL